MKRKSIKIFSLLLALLLLIPQTFVSAKAIDPEKELNTLTIVSKDANGKAIKGFVYKLTSDNGFETTIDLGSTSEIKIDDLKDGKYTLTSIKAPEGYKKEEAIKFELPFENKEEDYKTRELKINLKHIEEEKVYVNTNQTLGQSDNIKEIILVGSGLLVTFLAIALYVNKYGRENRTDK